MPDQRRLRGNLTYQLLRSKVSSDATKLPDFNAARRYAAPDERIYDVLVKEAYEEGCVATATHMERLVAKENFLKAKMIINDRMCYDHELLLSVYNMAKVAEHFSMRRDDCTSHIMSLKQLYHMLLTLEQHKQKYGWLLEDIYNYVMHAMNIKMSKINDLNELKARINYNYALLLTEKPEKRQNALKFFALALELSQGETWAPDQTAMDATPFSTLHAAVASDFSVLLFSSAREFVSKDSEQALILGQRAIDVLAEVGVSNNKLLIYDAQLKYVQLLLDMNRHQLALQRLSGFQSLISTSINTTSIWLRCKKFLQKGIAFYYLKDIKRAQLCLRMAHSLSQHYELKEFHLDILVYLGKAYAKRPEDYGKALQTFLAARRLGRTMNDQKRTKQVVYRIAELEAGQGFGEFMRILKSDEYCERYRLLEWKMHLRPFWLGVSPNSGALRQEPHQQQQSATMLHQLTQFQSGTKLIAAETVRCLMKEEYARCMKMPKHYAKTQKRNVMLKMFH